MQRSPLHGPDDRVAVDVTAGVVTHGRNIDEHAGPWLPPDWFKSGTQHRTSQRVRAVPHGDRRLCVDRQPPSRQSVGNIVTVSLDVGDLVAAVPRESEDRSGCPLIDGDNDRVAERLPRQPPPEPAGMPPRGPDPARELLHSADVIRFRRPHDLDTASHGAKRTGYRVPATCELLSAACKLTRSITATDS